MGSDTRGPHMAASLGAGDVSGFSLLTKSDSAPELRGEPRLLWLLGLLCLFLRCLIFSTEVHCKALHTEEAVKLQGRVWRIAPCGPPRQCHGMPFGYLILLKRALAPAGTPSGDTLSDAPRRSSNSSPPAPGSPAPPARGLRGGVAPPAPREPAVGVSQPAVALSRRGLPLSCVPGPFAL